MIYIKSEFYNSDNTKLFDVGIDNIKKSSNNNKTRATVDLPSWGIIANDAKIDFIDKNGEIIKKIKEIRDTTTLFAKIFIVNTLSGKQQLISKKNISNLQINDETKTVSASIVDDIIKMQKIKVEGFAFKTASSNPMSGKGFYSYLQQITPSIFNVCEFEELDSKTQQYLEKYIITYPNLIEGTLWQTWDKFAKALNLYVYKNISSNENGESVDKLFTSLDYSVYGV